MNTIHQLLQYALQELKDSYNESEIRSLCRIIFMDIFHFTNIDIYLKKDEILSKTFINKFTEIIRQLQKGQPIQYIIGETEFAGLKFYVNSSTLIPRPETQELVLWASAYISAGSKVLDIGTGSGCIAVTLASRHKGARITGIDISPEAIATAQANALKNQVEIDFEVRDILQEEQYSWEPYDLIISNPPYVREREKTEMENKVLHYEPHQALFVSDKDPLIFYRKIGIFGQKYLQPGGHLLLEINEALGKETLALLVKQGYEGAELRKDMFGKDRMIKAKKTN